MELTQQISMETKQILSQAQIQSLEILAMDAVELDDFLQNEYMSNPLMEHMDNHDHASVETESEKLRSKADRYDSETEYFDGSDYKPGCRRRNDEGEADVRDNLTTQDPDYLKNYFLEQIPQGVLSDETEWKLAEYMIACLGDDGFFRMSEEEVAGLTGADEKKVNKVLAVLRDLEPFGVFAAGLPECLIRQLEAAGEDEPGLVEIIRNYLPEMSEGKISVISRQTGFSTVQIRKYIAVIAKLNPRPLSGLRQAEVSYIVPDIIYTYKEGKWEIAINDRWSGGYRVNDYYFNLMKTSKDPELSSYFKQKLERCRFILNSIEQRRETMQLIAGALLEKQQDYFLGTGSLRPMTMTGLAGELEVHPSTISRAVKGKYIKSPAGTILIKKLFGNVIACEEGEEVTANQIKERIRKLVDSEDKHKPYSDAKLTELLVEEGIHISRRAVAKYRDELWIKSSFDRKIR